MKPHFQIKPADSFKIDDVARTIVEDTVLDPAVLHLSRGGGTIDSLVFCITPDAVDFQRQHFEQQGKVSVTYGACEIVRNAGVIHVHQDCDPRSAAQMKPVVLWILDTFGPCRVLDSDSQKEITDAVARNPSVLFE